MKSGSQRRTEIKTQRTGKRAAVRPEEVRTQLKRAAKERETQLKDKVLVNPTNLHPNNSYGTPDFVVRGYYADMTFTCKECGKPQVWTATQQKWWYESAKGDVWTIAVLCSPCRRRERERKGTARKIHLEGLAKKAQRDI